MTQKITVLPGDGIGPEIVAEAVKVLNTLRAEFGLSCELEEALIGGAGYDAKGSPLPDETLALARESDAILLGAVGGPKWEAIDRPLRPERGLLAIRSQLNLFANLRPAILYPQLAAASSLRPEVVGGLDILIVRELTGGIYFGEPRGITRAGFRRAPGLQHPGLPGVRDRADRPGGVRYRAQARRPPVFSGQGQCAGSQRTVARGDEPDCQRVHGRGALAHVR